MVMKTNEISFPSAVSNNVILQTLESKCICTLKNTQKSVAIFESPGQRGSLFTARLFRPWPLLFLLNLARDFLTTSSDPRNDFVYRIHYSLSH